MKKARAVLAKNIRIERTSQGLSQDELAHRCGVSRVHIGSIERGEVACSIDVIERLAVALEVKLSALVSER